MPLPKVTLEVINSVVPVKLNFTFILSQMEKENPALWRLGQDVGLKMIEEGITPEQATRTDGFFTGFITMYALLHRQDSISQLEAV